MNLDTLQRPRYALAIIIGLCMAPILFHCGLYVGASCPTPAPITAKASR